MRWRQRLTIQVGMLDRLMAEADAIRWVIDDGFRYPIVKSSERIFDVEGRPVWEVGLSVRRPPKEKPS